MFRLPKQLLALLVLAAPAAALQQDGNLIVLNKSANTATVLSLPGGEVVAKLPTGTGPHEVALSPDYRWAVVADYGAQVPGSSLTVIDLQKLEVAKTIDLGAAIRPHGAQFEPDGKSLWITAETRRELWQVSFPAGEVLRKHKTDQDASHMVALASDGMAYVANIASGSVTRVDRNKGEAHSVKTGAGAEGVAVSNDGKMVWVTNRAADTVTMLDASTMKVTKQIECPGFPIRVYLTPKGDKALVTCPTQGELAVINAKTGAVEHRIPMKLEAADDGSGRLFGDTFGESPVPIGTAINADGSRAYVANAQADKIAVVDLVAMKVVAALEAGREPDGIAWFPNAAKDRSAR